MNEWWDTTRVIPAVADIRESKVFIREGTYRPLDLGLRLEKVKWIHVGFCCFKPQEGLFGFLSTELAHAHSKDICFSNGAYLFSDEGVLDDVFVHEYCHILNEDYLYKEPHNKKWQAIALRYGLDALPFARYMYKS